MTFFEHNMEFSSAAESTRTYWNCQTASTVQTDSKATTATICYA
jgi:hypothetical protein